MNNELLLKLTSLLLNRDLVTEAECEKMIRALPSFSDERAQKAIDRIENQPCPPELRQQVWELMQHPCLFKVETLKHRLAIGRPTYRQALAIQADLQPKVDERARERQTVAA